MKKFAFISRHTPTPEQHALAEDGGIELTPIGDLDAFEVTADVVAKAFYDATGHRCEGVVVVHPAMAMNLFWNYQIGVFKNANRAAEGEKPSFQAVSLHVYQ